MSVYFSFFLSALFFFASIASAQDSVRPTESVPFFGVASHFLHTRQIYTDKDDSWLVSRTMPVQRELGTPWVTEQIYALTAKSRALVDDGNASVAEKARIADRRRLVDSWLGSYDEAGIRVLLTVMAAAPRAKNSKRINDDFGDWIAQLVERHPSVRVVQLHNEPNLRSFWPDTPRDYVALYRGISQKIKRKSPRVEIAVGAISSLSWKPGRDWLREALDEGVLEFADAVSIHPYNLTRPPEIDPHGDGMSLRRAITEFWQEIEQASPPGKSLKLYFTELGYSSAPTGIAGIGSESLQANYLARLMMLYVDFRLHDNIPLEAVFWYDLKNDGKDPAKQEHNFGLVSADLKRNKPALDVYRRIIGALPDLSTMTASDRVFNAEGDGIELLPWRLNDGGYMIALWRTGVGARPVIISTAGHVSGVTNAINLVSGESLSVSVEGHGKSSKLSVPEVSSDAILLRLPATPQDPSSTSGQ